MTENEKEITKEDFINEMTQFENKTAHKILDVLAEDKHMLSVEVLGLISLVRALINTYGDEYLLDTAVHYLQFKEPEEDDVPEAENMIEEVE